MAKRTSSNTTSTTKISGSNKKHITGNIICWLKDITQGHKSLSCVFFLVFFFKFKNKQIKAPNKTSTSKPYSQQSTPEATTQMLYLLGHGACEDQEGAESLQLLGCDGPYRLRAEWGSRRLPAARRLMAHVSVVLLQRLEEVIPGHRAGRPTCHISHSSGKLNVIFVKLSVLQSQLTEKCFKKTNFF